MHRGRGELPLDLGRGGCLVLMGRLLVRGLQGGLRVFFLLEQREVLEKVDRLVF